MAIRIKRIYEEAESSDGFRVLVDRLWPRGLSKQSAKIDYWAKEISPSNELRKWYSHEIKEWPEFRCRYFEELDSNRDGVEQLVTIIVAHDVTLVYSSKSKWNNALALKEYLEDNYPGLR